MALRTLIKPNANNAAVGTVPARSWTLHVVDDSADPPTIATVANYGKILISLADTEGSDGDFHEIKLREMDICVMVDDVPTTKKIIVLCSEPYTP